MELTDPAYSPNEAEALVGVRVAYFAWHERYLLHLVRNGQGVWRVDWDWVVDRHGE